MAQLPASSKTSEHITSLEVAAGKPSDACVCGGLAAVQPSLHSPAVVRSVAIGATVATNCELCFKHYYAEARKHGVTPEDMARAVSTAPSVKQAPAQAILELADGFLVGDCALVPETGCCPGPGVRAKTTSEACR